METITTNNYEEEKKLCFNEERMMEYEDNFAYSIRNRGKEYYESNKIISVGKDEKQICRKSNWECPKTL